MTYKKISVLETHTRKMEKNKIKQYLEEIIQLYTT